MIFGSMNVLRDLGVSRISWDKLRCVFWVSAKIRALLRFFSGVGYEKNERFCS